MMDRRVNGGFVLGFEGKRCSEDVCGSNAIASSSSRTTPPTSKYIAGNSFPTAVAAGTGGLSCIEHPVSKFDTLAGVAIKYGVEVADIKRLNGLVMDLQMFALKTLQIPLHGRHPPSPILSNGLQAQGPTSSEKVPSRQRHSDLYDKFQSLKLASSPQCELSPAMSSLLGYYSLRTSDERSLPQDLEMAVFQEGTAHTEDELFAKPSTPSNPPLGIPRKSRSVTNGFVTGNGDLDDHASADRRIDELLNRKQEKSGADFRSPPPEMSFKDENCSGGSFSAVKGKIPALRAKSANQTVPGADSEAGWSILSRVGSVDSVSTDSVKGVKKSPSTASLQESDSSTLLSIWPTSKWNLRPDLSALSTAGITRPIFDGIPNPITGRRNKVARD